MKIAIFLSGHVRTLFHSFHENLQVIKNSVGECEIDVFYSFWDSYDRSSKINDPWHSIVENYNFLDISTDSIDRYFKSHGVKRIDGEIESIFVMENIIKESLFPQNKFLSSQYYKKSRVVEKYFNDEYDFCIQMRSDIIIKNFLTMKNLYDIKDKGILIVNKYYWYNEPYVGRDCNEMIYCSGPKIFKEINQIYSKIKKISKGKEYYYGEYLTGTYFNNLLVEKTIDSILKFDFGFRVLR